MPPALKMTLTLVQEVIEEKEHEVERLRVQLQTAEQLLREAPKDLADSRPNSYISNSSSASDANIPGKRGTH